MPQRRRRHDFEVGQVIEHAEHDVSTVLEPRVPFDAARSLERLPDTEPKLAVDCATAQHRFRGQRVDKARVPRHPPSDTANGASDASDRVNCRT